MVLCNMLSLRGPEGEPHKRSPHLDGAAGGSPGREVFVCVTDGL